ncbi:MAG: hypothetical protein ACYC0Q_08590 [Eubacteriales bacterium]
MSSQIIEVLDKQFGFSPEEKGILQKRKRSLTREERRMYFQSIKPRERQFKVYLTGEYGLLNEGGREEWLDITVDNMMSNGGEPDLSDAMVMDLLGRLTVFHNLREMSEKKGVRLNAMTNFGGLSMVLYFFVIVTALILYFITR